MIGTEIANFRILEELGQGGMGAVYKAQDVNLDRTVALRSLNLDFAGNPDVEPRFRQEVQPLANLYHTNLVALHALLIEQGRPWMVTEFVEGETFEQMLRRRGPIPAEEALALFRQALFGIGYAHRKGLVHRDITPGNLIVNRDGVVKVMDFGLAKALSARGVAKPGTRFGKPAYMSPEQFLNRATDARSDVYSLGVVLYEMLAGKVPFAADNDYQIMADHVNTLPPHFAVAVPPAAELAVLKALEKNPDARHPSVEQFSAALSGSPGMASAPRAIAAVVPPVQAAQAIPASSRFLATRDQKLIAAAVVAILLLGGILTAMRIRSNRAEAAATQAQLNSPPAPQDAANPAPVPAPTPDAQPAAPVAPADGVAVAPADGVAVAPAQADAGDASEGPLIPAGTLVAVRMNDTVSSSANLPGQTFDASVDADVIRGGSVLVPAGTDATIRLIKVEQVPVAERSDLQLQLVNLNINGADYATRSSVFEQQSLPKTKKGAAAAGARAAFGALGGFLSHGSAGQGAAAGAASAFVVTIAPQTLIQFKLKKAVTLSQ